MQGKSSQTKHEIESEAAENKICEIEHEHQTKTKKIKE